MTNAAERIGMVVLGEHGEALRPVALTGVRVRVELRGLAARTVLTQTFRNTEAVPIEALYCFPLEEGSTVCAMRVRTGGRTLLAIAEEKEKAFKSYDDAMAAGHGAYLLDMERDDILTMSAGPLLSTTPHAVRQESPTRSRPTPPVASAKERGAVQQWAALALFGGPPEAMRFGC